MFQSDPLEPLDQTPPPSLLARKPLRLSRKARLVAGLASALAAGWLGLYLWANGDAQRARLRGEAEQRLHQLAPFAVLGPNAEVTPLGRVRLGPLWLRAGAQAEAWLYAETVEVRPSYRLLLMGRPHAATIALHSVRIRKEPSRQELQSTFPRARKPSSFSPPADEGGTENLPRLLIKNATYGCERRSSPEAAADPGDPGPGTAIDACPVGPIDGFVAVDVVAGRRRLRAEVTPPGGGRVQVLIRPDGSGVRAEARLDRIAVEPLLRGLFPYRVFPATAGTISGRLEAMAPSKDGRSGRASFDAAIKDLSFQGGQLAPQPLGPLMLETQGSLRWDLERAKKVDLNRLLLGLGDRGPRLIVAASLGLARELPLSAEVNLEPVAFQTLLDALPPDFRPAPEAPRLSGDLKGTLKINGPLRTPKLLTVQGGLDLSRLKPTASNGSSLPLDKPFRYRAVDRQGRERDVLIDPASPSFTPLDSLPSYVVSAVTVSEDAGFFAHRGFDFEEMKNSLADAMEAGREGRLRGASTITQQLAKNLFLSRERTLSRKVREALVTLTLEAALPKRRLLEIYLNAIEWGPQLYGIGEAARHYFDKSPSSLSVKEAAFLATIIPNPIRYYGYFQRGALTETWEQRVGDLLIKLWNTGAIDEAAFEEARVTPLRFAGRGDAKIKIEPEPAPSLDSWGLE